MTSFDPSTIHKYFIRPKGGEKYGNKYNVFYAMWWYTLMHNYVWCKTLTKLLCTIKNDPKHL